MTIQDIARLIPTIQAAHLVGANADVLKKKTGTKDILDLGVKNIVGIEVIRIESGLIAGL